jgi:hypothetical protein
MTAQELQNVIELSEATADGDWRKLPEGKTMTVHVASGGVGLAVSKVSSLRLAAPQVHLRTSREELFVVSLAEVFACAVDQAGNQGRKAGFVS